MPSNGQAQWVVGVDGSEGSLHALRWALAHVSGRSVSVTAVQCWQVLDGGIGDPGESEQRRQIESQLRRLRTSLEPDNPVLQVEAVKGHPVQVLLDRAERADLLIVGSRGLSGLKSLVLGSVSLHCATHSKVPVAIIRPEAPLDGALTDIVVGVDGSANSGVALQWALGFARETSDVHALRVWESRPSEASSDDAFFEALLAKLQADDNGALEEVLLGSEPGAPLVRRSFHYASAADALIERGAEADLLVVGSRGRGPVASAVLGSVSNDVVRRAKCPVVVVPG